MVRIGTFAKQEQPLPSYNPYDMVTINIGGYQTIGRPIEFDSEPVDANGYNAHGLPIKPTRISTSCPVCGGGIVSDVYSAIVCDSCGLGAMVTLPDPFCNPIAVGLVPEQEIVSQAHMETKSSKTKTKRSDITEVIDSIGADDKTVAHLDFED